MFNTPRRLRLVLVEDSDGYAALVGAMLAAGPASPEVVRFSRLDAALRHLAEVDPPDCVLLDLELPDATGTESVERILDAVPHVPVVVLTGHAGEALTGRVIRAGAQDLLVKGSETGGALMRAVRTAVDRRRSGDRRQVERLVREVAAEVRAERPQRRALPAAVGLTALAAGFAVLALLREPIGLARPRRCRPGGRRAAAALAHRLARGRRAHAVDRQAPYRDRSGKTAGIIGISRDETEMRRLEEESSRFFDLAPDMLGTIGADGRLQRVNEAWTATLGWTAEELRSRPLVDFLHPQDRARGARDLERLMAGGLDGCVHRVATRSGGWRDVEWTARAVDADERVYAVARDVTDRNAMAGALASSEARYRTLVHNLPRSSVVVFDHDLRFTFAAGEALGLAGLDGNVLGRTLSEVLPTRAAELTPRYRAALAGHEHSFEFAGDGRHYWCQMAPVRDGDGAIEGGMVLSQEITPLRHAERDLAHAEEMLRTAFEEAPVGMGVVSPDGRFLRVNRALCAITGYAPERLLGSGVEEITHPDDARADAAGRAELVAGRIDIHRAEKRYLHADGGSVWVSVHATLVRDADGNPSHILVHIQDITDRRQFEERLRHLVDHDPLTGLFNRRRFEQELDRRLAEAPSRGAVLVLDLDDFKLVNDTLGHNAGDELIVTVAGLLRAQLRETDVIARLGGDEFAVLLPAGSPAQAEAVAAKLIRAVREEARVIGDRRPRRVTTSVGVAIYAGGELTGEELLVNADLAMYEAKEAGRDRFAVYASSRHDPPRVEVRMRWVERIRDALEDDRFVLHAQPILDLRTGEIGQHELLVRMLDDDGDLIPPGAFLQVAERFDLVQEIDRWVACEALDLIARHAADGLRLTVNLSGRTLGDRRLLADLEGELARTGADAGRLTFEVTETAAVANIPQARAFAERVREIGCRFALDDFGAGFGSFYYLKHLPFDYLKVDGEFVSNCLTNRTDQLVIRAVVDIAQGLGKETVAEFAADAELVDFLRSQGVDHAQGFHIGRPQPLELALQPRVAG